MAAPTNLVNRGKYVLFVLGTGHDLTFDSTFTNLPTRSLTAVLQAYYFDSDGTNLIGTGTEAVGLSVAIYEDQKATGTDGGSSITGADLTRTLNTEVIATDSIATLSANAVTPISGTYLIEASAPAHKADEHRIYLSDGTSRIALGSSEYADATNLSQSRSFVSYIVTTTGSTAYSITHRVQTASTADGFGKGGTGGGEVEVYARLKLTRLGD
jgi:hypothetical protein